MDYTNIIKDVVGTVMGSNEHDMDENRAKEGLGSILPKLFGQIDENAKDPNERASLSKALKDHENDDLDNPKNFLDKFDKGESERMVDRIFGSKRSEVEQMAKKETGFSDSEVKKLLMLAAPLVIAHLAKKKKRENISDDDLYRETEKLNKSSSSILASIKNMLDKDGDGNPLNDILNL